MIIKIIILNVFVFAIFDEVACLADHKSIRVIIFNNIYLN